MTLPGHAANAALERADARELYQHYVGALQKCDKMSAAMTAMRVALAAIELAKAIIASKQNDHP